MENLPLQVAPLIPWQSPARSASFGRCCPLCNPRQQ